MEISDKANVINMIRAAAARRWRLYVWNTCRLFGVVVIGGETNDCVQFVNNSVWSWNRWRAAIGTKPSQAKPSQFKSLLEIVSAPTHFCVASRIGVSASIPINFSIERPGSNRIRSQLGQCVLVPIKMVNYSFNSEVTRDGPIRIEHRRRYEPRQSTEK